MLETFGQLFKQQIKLNDEHYRLFSEQLKTKQLHKKDYLIREGVICDFIGVVADGALRSYLQTESGEINNDFYFKDDFVSAYTSFLTQKPTNCNIQALTDCTVYTISNRVLDELITADLAFLRLSKYISDTHFIRKCKRETSFLKQSALERLEGLNAIYPGIEQKVSQYHIASYLGVKPESLSRIKLLTYINK